MVLTASGVEGSGSGGSARTHFSGAKARIFVGLNVRAEARTYLNKGRGFLAVLALLAATSPLFAAAKPPSKDAMKPGDPALRIDLGAIGYEPVQSRYLLAGGTMFTVNFVDDQHLLVTWSARGLLKRVPSDPPTDQDRNVDAVLLELPTGKVLARTTWRMHDHATYLWPLGGGSFLLRVRGQLSIIAPLENLNSANPFQERNVVHSSRPIGYVFVSPDHSVLTLETLPQPAENASGSALAPQLVTVDRVQINFFRIVHDAAGKVTLAGAGAVRSDSAIRMALTGGGYLETLREGSAAFGFDFVPYIGKRVQLSGFNSSCAPSVDFLSRSEFVAFGCRGSDDRQELGYFDLRGEHPWVATFTNQHINPFLIGAPDAGRFALERTILNSTPLDLDDLTDTEITGQEITVYQAYDGRQLLKLAVTPVQRAGQNIDLSPDGTSLAAFHDGAVEVYRLGAVTGKDRQAIDALAKLAPPDTLDQIKIGAVTTGESPDAVHESLPTGTQPAVASTPAAETKADARPTANVHYILNGDDQTKRTKPPSLYGNNSPNQNQPSQKPADPKQQ